MGCDGRRPTGDSVRQWRLAAGQYRGPRRLRTYRGRLCSGVYGYQQSAECRTQYNEVSCVADTDVSSGSTEPDPGQVLEDWVQALERLRTLVASTYR